MKFLRHVFFWSFIFCFYLMSSSAHAQSEQTKSETLRRWPLRVYFLPGSSTLSPSPKWFYSLPQKLNQAYKNSQTFKPVIEAKLPDSLFKEIEKTPLLKPETLYNIAQTIPADLFVHHQLIRLDTGYWFIIRVYSLPQGELIGLKKFSLPQISEAHIMTAFQKFSFDSLLPQLQHIVDLGPLNSTGELHLSTIPIHQLVRINNQYLGKTPLIIRHIPDGNYNLEVYEEHPLRWERFRITSTPPNIPVHINQQLVGKTPVDLNKLVIKPGTYQISFKSETDFDAAIEMSSRPNNLGLRLDNSRVQRTPITFQSLNRSDYALEIFANRPIAVKKNIQINSNQIEHINLDLYKFSRLSIDTSEDPSQVYIDNEKRGETPFTTTLPQGLHKLELHKQRFKTQYHNLALDPGKKYDFFFPLSPRSIDTSIFLTPTGEMTSQFNISGKYLGFGTLIDSESKQNAQFYGVEVDYGWPQLYKAYDTFELGLSVSSYLGFLQTDTEFRNYQGLGLKLQFLKEGSQIPVSAAVGSYVNLDLNRPQMTGFISLSRSFFDFTLHLGLQTHGMNVNIGYTGWDNFKIGLVAFANSFFGLLTLPGEELRTLYGLQLGYNF